MSHHNDTSDNASDIIFVLTREIRQEVDNISRGDFGPFNKIIRDTISPIRDFINQSANIFIQIENSLKRNQTKRRREYDDLIAIKIIENITAEIEGSSLSTSSSSQLRINGQNRKPLAPINNTMNNNINNYSNYQTSNQRQINERQTYYDNWAPTFDYHELKRSNYDNNNNNSDYGYFDNCPHNKHYKTNKTNKKTYCQTSSVSSTYSSQLTSNQTQTYYHNNNNNSYCSISQRNTKTKYIENEELKTSNYEYNNNNNNKNNNNNNNYNNSYSISQKSNYEYIQSSNNNYNNYNNYPYFDNYTHNKKTYGQTSSVSSKNKQQKQYEEYYSYSFRTKKNKKKRKKYEKKEKNPFIGHPSTDKVMEEIRPIFQSAEYKEKYKI